MKKCAVIRIVSYCLALSAVLCGVIIKQNESENQYRRQISNMYKESLYSLCSAVNDITDSIEKMLYTNSSSQMLSFATELTNKAQIAKTELSQLPNSDELSSINKFLSQIGNYSLHIYKGMLDEDADYLQRQNLEQLYKTSQSISNQLSDAVMYYEDSNEILDELEESIENEVSGGLSDSIHSVEESITDYPELIYDGPYSDHFTKKVPSMLADAENISVEKGLLIAENMSGSYDELSLFEKIEGEVPVYVYADGDTTVAVSVNGGYTVYLRKYREITGENLKDGQAIEFADKYLLNAGFQNMVKTYYYLSNGVYTISYAYLDGATLCYPDLIKVGVAADTGEIVLLETAGYLYNHKERALPTPSVTQEEAGEMISGNLQIVSTASVLIPKDSENEVRCFEFLCNGIDGRKILLYLNAETLEEEQIFLVDEDENGVLVK